MNEFVEAMEVGQNRDVNGNDTNRDYLISRTSHTSDSSPCTHYTSVICLVKSSQQTVGPRN